MGFMARIKSLAGGNGQVPSIASATTVNLPNDSNAFLLTGTTTITSLICDPRSRNRMVTFFGTTSTAATFTNTNSPAANKMYLHGANRTIQDDDVIQLYCKNDGTWILMNLVN